MSVVVEVARQSAGFEDFKPVVDFKLGVGGLSFSLAGHLGVEGEPYLFEEGSDELEEFCAALLPLVMLPAYNPMARRVRVVDVVAGVSA